MYENDIFSLCESSNEFIHVLLLHWSVRTVKIDQNNIEISSLLLGLSSVWNL